MPAAGAGFAMASGMIDSTDEGASAGAPRGGGTGAPRTLVIPTPSLVVLIGAAGSGKSTFARHWFPTTATVSSDACRAMVADDESDQSATGDAFDLVHLLVHKRLHRRRLTVVDATNVQAVGRRPLLDLARRHHLPVIALVFDASLETCRARAASRGGRVVPDAVIERQIADLAQALPQLPDEGYRAIHHIDPDVDPRMLDVRLEPLASNRPERRGPFDIIGDVHGCGDELEALLTALGYRDDADRVRRHPEGRTAVFVGDLVDRGPRIADVLTIAMRMVRYGGALAVPGNHDDKLLRWLRGRAVTVANGLAESLDQLHQQPAHFRESVEQFLGSLPSHLLLDEGRLVVAHAGLPGTLHGRDSRRVRDFALYGETTGRVDEQGAPIRGDWAARYRGRSLVVYGHTPAEEARWLHETVNIDTGCVFGGQLTALRYPERTTVSVPAARMYTEPRRAFVTSGA